MNQQHVDDIFKERVSDYSTLAKANFDLIKGLIERMKLEMKERVRESEGKNVSRYLHNLETWFSEKTDYFNQILTNIELIKKVGFAQDQILYKLVRQTQDALAHAVSQLRVDLQHKRR